MRHDEETIEAARVSYLTDCDRDRARVAEKHGIPRRTVDYWALNGDWAGDWERLQAPEGRTAARVAMTAARMALPAAVASLVDIISERGPVRDMFGKIIKDEDGQPLIDYKQSARDRAYAARMLRELAQLESVESFGDGAIPAAFSIPDDMSPEQQVGMLLEATYSSVNTRTDVPRGRGRR